MAFPAKKLKSFVKEENKRERASGDEDGGEGSADGADEHDDEDTDAGQDKGGDKMVAMVEKAARKVDDGGDDALVELVEGYDGEDGPPSGVKDSGLWAKAEKAVRKTWEDFDEPWCVVAHVYDLLGGSVA